VRARARDLGKKLTQPVARALVEATGTNLIALENELAKLTVYVGQRDAITENDLAEITTNARARSVFDLAESVVKGDAEQALQLCTDLLLRGEAKEGIVAILALQLRRYWQVRRLRDSGLGEQGIGRELGMPSFAVRRALPIARRLSDDWFADRLDILSRADYESKTDSLRAGEEQVWVESLLARLCGGKGRAG
jgi:DNA polymerase-3 subunit delta